MNRVLKWSLGLLTVAGAAHVVYHGYQNFADEARENLTFAIRAYFSDEEILALWVFEDPIQDACFEAGVVVSTDNSETDAHSESQLPIERPKKSISFLIDAQSLEIIEKSEEWI